MPDAPLPAEPELVTEPRLAGVLDELLAREPIFHRPELGHRPEDFEAMTAPDFWEVGASGRRYGRAHVLAILAARYADGPYPDEWQVSDGHCRELADGVYALTYTLRQGERVTRRLTLWRRGASGWVILYHQGTAVAG